MYYGIIVTFIKLWIRISFVWFVSFHYQTPIGIMNSIDLTTYYNYCVRNQKYWYSNSFRWWNPKLCKVLTIVLYLYIERFEKDHISVQCPVKMWRAIGSSPNWPGVEKKEIGRRYWSSSSSCPPAKASIFRYNVYLTRNDLLCCSRQL